MGPQTPISSIQVVRCWGKKKSVHTQVESVGEERRPRQGKEPAIAGALEEQ